MPAPFAKSLCRYRPHGKANTSDRADQFSVELGQALFDVLGVDREAIGDEPTGGPFARRVSEDLDARLTADGSSITVAPEKRLNEFQQFRHVGALRAIDPGPSREFLKQWNSLAAFARRRVTSPPRDVMKLEELLGLVNGATATDTEVRQRLLDEVGGESLLKLDVTVAHPRPEALPELEIGLSLKWSLRTDRAQDCRSQGAKLSSLRRGRMPHFAAVTMEPRPYMLNLLGGGSGDVDCVYHLDLPALTTALEVTCSGTVSRLRTVSLFRRLVEQRRVRDYDELVSYALTV